LEAKAASAPGRYADGNSLYLVVEKSGSKHWIIRTVVHGRRRDIGLGSFSAVTLAEARDKAYQYRKTARAGGDPIKEHRQERSDTPLFREAAKTVHAEHKPGWRNGKHADQWLSTLEAHAFPAIGNNRVDQIDAADILRVLRPIWLEKSETARRVRQRIKIVLDWAKASGHRTGDNPVELAMQGLPKQTDQQAHFKALPHADVPGFIKKLRACSASEITRLAFEFLILTAARTGEVIEARWDEIDMQAEIWTVPAERAKTGREHRVPLSPRALEILRRANKISAEGNHIFPGRAKGKGLSNMAFLKIIERLNFNITAHGFRSTFRDWCAEKTDFSSELAEMALAHAIKNRVEAAYRRGDLLDKRRPLMQAWEAACITASPSTPRRPRNRDR
jgi:integrase